MRFWFQVGTRLVILVVMVALCIVQSRTALEMRRNLEAQKRDLEAQKREQCPALFAHGRVPSADIRRICSGYEQ